MLKDDMKRAKEERNEALQKAKKLIEGQVMTTLDLKEALGCSLQYSRSLIKTLRERGDIEVDAPASFGRHASYSGASKVKGTVHTLLGDPDEVVRRRPTFKIPEQFDLHQAFFGRANAS